MSSAELTKSASQYELTICTVSFHHAPHLRLNYDLVRRLNPNAKIRWVIGENSPLDSDRRLAPDEFADTTVLATESLGEEGMISAQYHIAAMKACLAEADTRFVLLLDPDFYVLRPNWVADVISYMQQNKLAMFGAPWHPRHPRHYPNFPCVHFTMVDNECFSNDRPYTPDLLMDEERASLLKAEYTAPGVPATGVERAFRHWLRQRFPDRWRDAWAIADTGSVMFARYWQGEPILNECLLPVFYPGDYRKTKLVRGWKNRIFETIMPADIRHWGRDPKTYTRTGGFLPRTEETKMWEEFLWQGEIFGFHMRGHPRSLTRDRNAEIEMVRTVLNEYAPAPAMP
jgi:hypothetical protein